MDTGSCLPPFVLLTDSVLDQIEINLDDIDEIVRNLDVKKAHGCDDISIRLIKLCGDAINFPLFIIYKNCLSKGTFSKCLRGCPLKLVYPKVLFLAPLFF